MFFFETAAAQKNIGISGLGVVIARNDICERDPLRICPALMSYKNAASSDSLFNTPSTWGIYITGMWFLP